MSHRLAVETFVDYAQVAFGYPNDEARGPIFPGLVYACCEIVGSGWNARLTEQNRLAFPDAPAAFNHRHYVTTCHETTLQVLASDFLIHSPEKSLTEVAMAVLHRQISDEAITVTPRSGE